MKKKINILLCSPFYPDKENTTCGVANWTRNIYKYYKSLEEDEFSVKLLPFDRSVDLGETSSILERLISGARDYFHLVKLVKKELSNDKYDIVQISTSASLGLLKDYMIAHMVRKKGGKAVFHFHFGRIPYLYAAGNYEWRVLTKVLKISTAGISMDRASFDTLNQVNLCKTYYLPNPLSKEIIEQINTSVLLPRKSRQLLFVGHVVRGKGVYELVEACASISDIKLKLIGKCDPSVKSDLLSIAESSTGNWLEFAGEIPHTDVIKEMMLCDIFVLPTYSEGFPNVILESMACGCPIIASGVGAIPEMLKDGDKQCGILIQPKSVKSLSEAINKYLTNDELKLIHSKNAKTKVNQSYTISSVWDQLKCIWGDIAK